MADDVKCPPSGDSQPAFDLDRCGIENVPRIPDRNMICDPDIPAPPPDILECNTPPLAPLDPEPPCPTIEASGTFELNRSVGVPVLAFEASQGDCCDFDFNLNLQVPCATITSNVTNTRVPFTDDDSEATVQFVPRGDVCDYELDFNLQIHCPQLGPAVQTLPVYLSGDSPGSVTFGFERTGECDWTAVLDLTIPCPSIGPASSSVSLPFSGAGPGTLNFGFAQEDCNYTLNLGGTSGCSSMQPSSLQTVYPPYVYNEDEPDDEDPAPTRVIYGFSAGPDCSYELEIDMRMHCTEMKPPQYEDKDVEFFELSDEYQPPKLEWGFARENACDWRLDMKLTMMQPKILGKVDTNVNKSGFATVSVFSGPVKGAETDTGLNLTNVYDRFAALEKGAWVHVEWIINGWEMTAAECNGGSYYPFEPDSECGNVDTGNCYKVTFSGLTGTLSDKNGDHLMSYDGTSGVAGTGCYWRDADDTFDSLYLFWQMSTNTWRLQVRTFLYVCAAANFSNTGGTFSLISGTGEGAPSTIEVEACPACGGVDTDACYLVDFGEIACPGYVYQPFELTYAGSTGNHGDGCYWRVDGAENPVFIELFYNPSTQVWHLYTSSDATHFQSSTFDGTGGTFTLVADGSTCGFDTTVEVTSCNCAIDSGTKANCYGFTLSTLADGTCGTCEDGNRTYVLAWSEPDCYFVDDGAFEVCDLPVIMYYSAATSTWILQVAGATYECAEGDFDPDASSVFSSGSGTLCSGYPSTITVALTAC